MGEWCGLQSNYHVKRSLSYILEDCVYVKVVFGLIFQRHFTQSMVAPDWLKHWYIHTWLVTVHCIFLPGTPYTPANQTYHLKSSIYWQHQGAPTVTLGLRKSHCFLYLISPSPDNCPSPRLHSPHKGSSLGKCAPFCKRLKFWVIFFLV